MIRALILVTLLISAANAWPMTDPAGDAVTNTGQAASNGSGSDLLELRIEESETQLDFYITTEDWRAATTPFIDSASILIPFSYGESNFAIGIDIYNPPGSLAERLIRANLLADFKVGSGYGRQYLSLETEVTGAEVHTWFEKKDIRDENGAPLVAGRTITGIHASSLQGHIGQIDNENYAVTMDRMPDSGTMDLDLIVGKPQSETLQLISLSPLRWSNGGATIFAFEPRVLALENETVTFAAENIPAGWIVHVPEPTMILDDRVTVYLETPTRHNHAGEEMFTLMASKGEHTARLDLGVFYPEIPMPAGHHADLYLHGRPAIFESPDEQVLAAAFGVSGIDFGNIYMNTDESQSSDAGPIPADFTFDERSWVWPVMLEPFLRTGLNFTESPSPVEITTESPTIPTTGTLSGELIFLAPEGGYSWGSDEPIRGHALATFSEQISLGDTVTTEWQGWNLTDTSYRPGVQLAMNLFFDPDPPENLPIIPLPTQGPWTPVLTGGKMTLPLGEYHDDVTIPLTEAQETELTEKTEAETLSEETPMIGLLWLLATVALAASFQRRLRN
jgi:hypothetical protein